MNEISKVKRSQVLIEKLVNLWENSVKASHLFLSNKEIEEIKKPSQEVFCDGFFKFFICIYLNLLKEYKI